MELARLVDLAAQQLHLTLEYDAAALKGPVTLRLASPLSNSELWGLLNRVLATRGFTTVRMPGEASYSVVRLADAPGWARRLDSLRGEELPAGFGIAVIRAQHRPAKELAESVSKVLPKGGGTVAASGEDGLLIIVDLASRIEQTAELLRILDSESEQTRVEEVPVRNLAPQQLAAVVMQVVAKRDAVSGGKTTGETLVSPNGGALLVVAPQSQLPRWRELISGLDQREPVETINYTPAHFVPKDVAKLLEQTVRDASDDRWKLVVDDLTASLVVTATASQHRGIEATLARLASAPSESRRPMRTYVVRNRPVQQVQSVIEELLRAGAIEEEAALPLETSPRPARAALPSNPAPGSTSAPVLAAATLPPGPHPAALMPAPANDRSASPRPIAGQAQEVVLTSDLGTNTLIAVAEPRIQDQIEKLLRTLDVRQPQVMLEVLMVTLSESDSLTLGVELDALVRSGNLRGRLSSLFGLSKRDGDGGLNPGDASGFTGVVLSPGDFAAVIRALQTISSGRSLSMPKLLVGNNQQASIDSTVQQPFASVNASNTVSTTSFGGSSDAGTTVSIKPQIAEGDHLVLDYSVSLSSFVGSAAAATLPPPKQQNKVQSAATIPDGYTVVVGGIELESGGRSTSQVPFLGRIPVLGEAFKTRSNSTSRSRFYVFIRANILRSRTFEDLKYLSARDAAGAGVDNGLPTVEPRVIR